MKREEGEPYDREKRKTSLLFFLYDHFHFHSHSPFLVCSHVEIKKFDRFFLTTLGLDLGGEGGLRV